MSLHSKSNSVWSRLIHASSIYSIFYNFGILAARCLLLNPTRLSRQKPSKNGKKAPHFPPSVLMACKKCAIIIISYCIQI